MKKRTLFLIGSLIIMVNVAMAQWVSDPSANTLLAGVDSAYAYGEMVGNSNDSASYLLYYKSTLPKAPFFNLYLQKIDYHGYRKFGNDGILIDPGPNRTWVSGVAVVPNQDSCVYVAYSKVQFYPGPEDTVNAIFLNKLTKNGVKMWGDEGVQISKGSTACSSFSPYLLVTEDNQVCIGYITIDSVGTPIGNFQNVILKKLSATGTLIWEYTFPREFAEFNWGVSMYPTANGNIMAICRHDSTDFSDTSFLQSLWAQKIDANGLPLFAHPKNILSYPKYTGDYPMTMVHVERNSEDGFYVGVAYDQGAVSIQTFIQHIDADANTLFPEPVPVVIDAATDLERADFGIRYLPETQELLVVWAEKNFSTHTASILGQKISSTGTRIWGDSAKELYPKVSMLDSTYAFLTLRKSGINESILFFMKRITSSAAIFSYANKLDPDGNSVWGKTTLLSNKSGNNVALLALEEVGNQWVAYYTDQMDTTYSHLCKGQLFGQNIFNNGSIGVGVKEIVPVLSSLTVYPNPASGNISVDFELETSSNIQAALWSQDGRMIRNWEFSNVSVGKSHLSFDVKGIPDGLYILRLFNGTKSSTIKVMIQE
ncbi:MAG: T9SS type A sorting domain-containing protein [Bacteroidales bacterium]|nr:T9SS type A sorting domain-containing protein [Bacteroidales bacterium]